MISLLVGGGEGCGYGAGLDAAMCSASYCKRDCSHPFVEPASAMAEFTASTAPTLPPTPPRIPPWPTSPLPGSTLPERQGR